MKCRLLYLIGQLGPGGSERQLYVLLKALDRERYRPAVAVWHFCEADTYVSLIRALGVPVLCFSGRLSVPGKLIALRHLVKEICTQVVHSYSFYTNIAASVATAGTTAVAIGSIRSDFSRAQQDSGLLLGNLNARWPHNQICNSHSVAKAIQDCRILTSHKLHVVRNGLDLDYFQSADPSTNGPVKIVGLGSLLPVKRWDRLLDGALALKTRGFNFSIQIIGDGPLRENLTQKINALGVTGCVNLAGHKNNIPKYLAEATFLVHTSDSEGCPNAVMEAMACGRPVIATDAGDVPALIEDGRTGFVVRRGDDAALVDRMTTLLTDRDLCRRMGKASRTKAEREFGVDRLVADTLAVYEAAGRQNYSGPKEQ